MDSRTSNPKVAASSLRSGRNCRRGEWITNALSTFNTMTEVRPLSKALNPQLLPGAAALAAHCSGCVFTTVCVHLDGLNAEHKFWVGVTILGHMSLHSLTHYWCFSLTTHVKCPAELPTVFWQTPGSCGNLIAIPIHISEFTRRNRFKIQCLIPFWPLPNTATVVLRCNLHAYLFLKCCKLLTRTIFHNCSTTASESKKRRKARKHSKWVFIMAAAGMQYNFKMCIIYITILRIII